MLWDEEKGLVASAKVSSNKADPSRAVIASVDKLGGENAGDVRYLIHGTTVATNATLERSGPRIGMICTAGFRDVLEIARLTRPPEQIYDLRANPSRRPRFSAAIVLKSMSASIIRGNVIGPLEESSVVEPRELPRAAASIVSRCASCTPTSTTRMNARCATFRAREMLGAPISISSEVLPEFRGIRTFQHDGAQRLSGADRRRLSAPSVTVTAWNNQTRLWVMQRTAAWPRPSAPHVPVTLLLSGPSGGVVAGRYLIEQTGLENGITVDMGGTSFDVCLLPGQGIPMTHERHVMDMPIRVSSVDILTIGAGGGSIGWFDAAGQFRVGPQSAGATPGPACYNGGGEEPTVTGAGGSRRGPEQRLAAKSR